MFLSSAPRMHWPLQDPDRKHEDLTDEERLHHFRVARDQIRARLEVLAALRDVPEGPDPQEFHASIRVPDLPAAARFYSWLLGVAPKEWTHRYVTFVSEALRTNFVLLVDDGKELHQDTLYHLGGRRRDEGRGRPGAPPRRGGGVAHPQASAHHLARDSAARALAEGPGREPHRDLRAPHRRRARGDARGQGAVLPHLTGHRDRPLDSVVYYRV